MTPDEQTPVYEYGGVPLQKRQIPTKTRDTPNIDHLGFMNPGSTFGERYQFQVELGLLGELWVLGFAE